jgi:hypothetical protein
MTNVLLATSNGTGMGHLTRQAAVGLALAPGHQVTLFSLSIGLPLAMSLGLDGEYCPSYDRPWIASTSWHGYLHERLSAIIEETSTGVVLFDGVAPYPGIGRTSLAMRGVAFVWLRRGMWRPGTSRGHLRKAGYFDRVIEPGDLGGDQDIGPTADVDEVIRTAPISLVEVLEPHGRDQARKLLGLPADREVALVTLGSGRLGDVAGPGEVALREILENSDLHVAVTRPQVAESEVPVDHPDRVSVIRDVYPLVPFLSAFDMAVSSAGYNAVHELVPSGVPTMFVANTSTRTDDQEARSRRLAELGLGLWSSDRDRDAVAAGTRRLLDPPLRAEIGTAAAATLPRMLGAAETAGFVSGFGATFTRRRPKASVLVAEQVQRAKDGVKGALGEERTNRLKAALGRHPGPATRKARVRVVDVPVEAGDGPLPLLVTESLSPDQLRMPLPVEHVLRGSSQAYRDRRMEIIETYYDVAG